MIWSVYKFEVYVAEKVLVGNANGMDHRYHAAATKFVSCFTASEKLFEI